jgi:hypothetical protein
MAVLDLLGHDQALTAKGPSDGRASLTPTRGLAAPVSVGLDHPREPE